MIVKQAKDVARQWVLEQARDSPGFGGAFFHGSTNWLPDRATLPATSDVDVMIVLDDSVSPEKLGKIIFRDVLLDVSYVTSDQIISAEQVLGQYHLAGSFHAASVITDPSGKLTVLQADVSARYAQRRWVYRRCDDARNRVLRNLQSLDDSTPWHDQVTAWLFATGVTTHVLLVAGLKNPTVRRRYVAVRELLADYGHSPFYESLLELLGCERMSRERVEHHLAKLADVFDAAKTVGKTPFFFTSDISDVGRAIVIDGSRELIEQGDHREAVFWMLATYARCQKVLGHDAPIEMRERHTPGFDSLLADLGISSSADIWQRGEQVAAALPRLWEVGEAIIASNPGIEADRTSGNGTG